MGFPLETLGLGAVEQLETFSQFNEITGNKRVLPCLKKKKNPKNNFFLQRNKVGDVLTWSREALQCPFVCFISSVMCQLLFQAAGETILDKTKTLPSAVVATAEGKAARVSNACRE